MVERGSAVVGELRDNNASDTRAALSTSKADSHPPGRRDVSRLGNMSGGGERAWNTRDLGLRFGSDVLAALSAGGLVAPIITVIDRGIMENLSGVNTLGRSMRASLWRLVTRPHRFVFSKPFALVLCLYSGTYLAANTVDTVSSTVNDNSPKATTAGPPKFIATTATNLALCLYKDSKFTQMFGKASAYPPRPVGLPTFALFTLRDCLTIFASFNLPTMIAPHLPMRLMGEQVEKSISRMSAAQFLTPAVVQLFSTPLHLLGLDIYNRQRATWHERVAKVRGEWGKSTLARIGRIVPAFGVGGVVNRRVRERLMSMLE